MKCREKLSSRVVAGLLRLRSRNACFPGYFRRPPRPPPMPCSPPVSITGSIEQPRGDCWWPRLVRSTRTNIRTWYGKTGLSKRNCIPAIPGDGLTVPNSGAGTPTHKLHGSPLAFIDNPTLIGSPDT